MKKYIIGIMSAAALSCIILSCTMPAEPQAEAAAQAEPGFGKVSISFATGPARTVFPDRVFDHYTYNFQSQGTPPNPQPTQASDGTYTLQAGSWTVAVKAYALEDDSGNDFAASGSSDAFEVRAGVVTPVIVPLTGKTDSGNGTFKYNIQYPAGTTITATPANTAPSFTLKKLPSLTPEASLGSLTWGATSLVSPEAEANVAVGFYLVNVKLQDQLGRKAGKTEVVHIYKNMTTTYSVTFQTTDFERPETTDTVSITDAAGTALASPLKSGDIIKATVSPAITTPGDITYAWYTLDTPSGSRTAISNATNQTYTLTDNEQGKYISVTVTFANYRNTLSLTSPVGPVKNSVSSLSALTAWLAGLPDNASGPAYEVALTGSSLSLASLHVTDEALGGRKASIDLSGLSDTSLANSAFSGCTFLTGVTFPATITEIKANAFNGCTSLTEITLPASLTDIKANAFSNCSALTTIICLAVTPPADLSLSGSAFTNTPSVPDSLTIKVPAGSAEAYRLSEWATCVSNPDTQITDQ